MKNKPPYWLGLICLVPLIGAFVGVGLILFGVFKYKSKALVLIGFLGLIFTILLYSLLFHNLKYGKETGDAFAKIAKRQLTDLVKDIEFYKQQTGSYPDSLDQLRKYDSLVIIEDPLLTRKMDKNLKVDFEYQKIGNRYTVFSVGIDGVSNSSDDIYPDILGLDSNKIGLIRR